MRLSAGVINVPIAKLLLVQSSLATQALGAPLWARCYIVSRCPPYAPGMHVRKFEPSRPALSPLTQSKIFADQFLGFGLAPWSSSIPVVTLAALYRDFSSGTRNILPSHM